MKICIPAIAEHLAIVRVSIHWLRKTMPGVDIMIVCPEPRQFAEFLDRGVQVDADRAYAPLSKLDLRERMSTEKRLVVGWYYQQLLKFAIADALKTDKVLILDADTVLLKDLRTPRVSFYTTNEQNEPYFEHYTQLTGWERSLSKSAVTNFMFFEPNAVRDMLTHIEQRHQRAWWEAVIEIANSIPSTTAFSEYETYANWSNSTTPGHTTQPLRMFRRGDLLVGKPPNFERVCVAASRRGYDAIAFEMQHRSNLRRRLMARIVMALGLSPW